MDNLNLYQVSRDYDVAQFHVEAISKNAKDRNDFYNQLEQYVINRKALFK